jgi:hypothetical protein
MMTADFSTPTPTHLQNENAEAHTKVGVFGAKEVCKLVAQIRADVHVGEHAVQFVSELVATRLLQVK